MAAGEPVFFSIKNKSEGDARLDIFDATGRLVFSKKTELESGGDDKFEINAGTFAPGLHTARLQMVGRVLGKRFLVGGF